MNNLMRWLNWESRNPPLPDEGSEQEMTVLYTDDWAFCIRPAVSEYRVVVDDTYNYTHRFDLEALFKGVWVVVERWDDGHDRWGYLHPPQWERLGGCCAWTKDDLERFAKRLLEKSIGRKHVRSVVND